MGGIHMASRTTYNNNYIGVKSDLTLPTNVSADSRKGIKPEFFFGFYKDSHGIDIGVVYESNAFRLFYWTSAKVPPTGYPRGSANDPDIGASTGEKIELKAYLNGSKITCEATTRKGKTKLDCPLSPEALASYKTGAAINRELNIAADEPAGYNPKTGLPKANPCNVYFKNAVFTKGYVTNLSGQQILLNPDSSRLSRNKYVDDYVDKSILKECVNEIGVEAGNNCSYERASCDFNRK